MSGAITPDRRPAERPEAPRGSRLNGWVKLHRAVSDHAVWHLTPGQFKVFVTILIMANFQKSAWWDGRERVPIPPGNLVTSGPHLAEAAGVSRIVVRHALSNLEAIGSIRAKTRAKRWTLIEVVNWPLYQGADDEVSQEASPRRAHGEPTVSHNVRTKERKNEKNPNRRAVRVATPPVGAAPLTAPGNGDGEGKPEAASNEQDKVLEEPVLSLAPLVKSMEGVPGIRPIDKAKIERQKIEMLALIEATHARAG